MEYRNAKRLSNGWIDCEIKHPIYGWIPFTCNPQDAGAMLDAAELHSRMNADAETLGYIPPTQAEIDAKSALEIRVQRDNILTTVVDPFVSNLLRWRDLTADQQQAWADYRRALLDVPQQAGFPQNVSWPVKPE